MFAILKLPSHLALVYEVNTGAESWDHDDQWLSLRGVFAASDTASEAEARRLVGKIKTEHPWEPPTEGLEVKEHGKCGRSPEDCRQFLALYNLHKSKSCYWRVVWVKTPFYLEQVGLAPFIIGKKKRDAKRKGDA